MSIFFQNLDDCKSNCSGESYFTHVYTHTVFTVSYKIAKNNRWTKMIDKILKIN